MSLFPFLSPSVAVSRSKSVPMFGPPLPPGGRFAKSRAFADFLLAKIVNAENAAHLSDKFVTMAVGNMHTIETFKFLLLKLSLFPPHQTFHITTPLELDFGSDQGLVI